MIKFKNKWLQKSWKFLISFKLGIPVLVSLTLLMIWGTIVESLYDAYAASKIVYSSIYMYVVMALLIINLLAVIVDRWPWQRKHYPFVLVHIGIIVLILGGWVTQKFGIDGSLAININSKNQYVSISDTDLVVYATFDGDRYSQIYQKKIDFFKDPPNETRPFEINLGESSVKIVKYLKYAKVNKKILSTDDPKDGSHIKILLKNANVKQVEDLVQPAVNKSVDVNLGPLKIYLGHPVLEKGRVRIESNEVYFYSSGSDGNQKISYSLFRKNETEPFKKGSLSIGDIVETGWMGLSIQMIDYRIKAKEQWDAIAVDRPTPLTTSAVLIDFQGKQQWALLNDIVKLFSNSAAYIFSYQNRRLDLGFPVFLKEFKKENYQGTMKAKAYSSQVSIQKPGISEPPLEALIQMNEPLKFGGYTFYQSSFVEDEKTGEPTASVLSVNFDPGRVIKYIGSLILSIGIILIFIQTRKRRTAVQS